MINQLSKKEFYVATPPSALVGERNYPFVKVGVNVTDDLENATFYDSPKEWWGKLSLEDIIRLRSKLIFSSIVSNVKRPRLLEEMFCAAASIREVSAEVVYKKPPKPSLYFDTYIAPRGPSGEVEKFRLVDNPSLPKYVERILYDPYIKAGNAMMELYARGNDVYYLVRLLSTGLLGRKIERKLVPTRWAITAVDKTLSDIFLKKVTSYPAINDILAFSSRYLGNRYLLLMFPGPWSFEMIEIWHPRSVWVKTDFPEIFNLYEYWDGKLRGEIDGGYYAIRLPVLEWLLRNKRQATVIAIREITRDYYAPVGSWQIRESIRAALSSKPVKVSSIHEIINILKKFLLIDFRIIVNRSKILDNMLRQKSIIDFLVT